MREKLGSWLAHRADTRARRMLATNQELTRDLTAYLEKSRSTGCSYSDFAALYSAVRKLRPKYVLELGTGASTIVIAHALKVNGGGIVVSMEENKEYYEHALSLVPSLLAQYIEIHHSPAEEVYWGFFRGAHYTEIPKHPYEFVFVDGPSFLSDGNKDLAFNFDFLDVVRNSDTPVSALIDGRQSTCFVYQEFLGDKVRYDYVRNLGVASPSTKKDVLTPAQIVRRAFGAHRLKRPPFMSYLRSFL